MSQIKRTVNNHILVLSKQYETLGMLIRMETEAIVALEITKVVEIRQRTLIQFKELGTQMKTLVKDVDLTN